MKTRKKTIMLVVLGLLLPILSHAQESTGISGFHQVLSQLYDEMMPLCSQLTGVAQGIAGFAALWYIGVRVWRHIANAEPIDFYPLFRPFVLGFCIMIFPSVLAMMNGVLKPTVTATASMVQGSKDALARLLDQREEAVKQTEAWQMYVGADGTGDFAKWYKYSHDGEEVGWSTPFELGVGAKFMMSQMAYAFKNSIREWMAEVLNVLYQAAALCIDTLRTFQLVVLSILGPLVFGLAVFDGLQHTLAAWLARYINIFLWLPVANIFGAIISKIQEQMIRMDLAHINQAGDTFFSRTDIAYLIFMIIGIVGYFTVPSVASYIVQAGSSTAIGNKASGAVGRFFRR